MAELYLVRHGQASFLADDYDKLSPMGEIQAGLLGAWLTRCGQRPDAVATGRLSRQIRTADLCLEAAESSATLVERLTLEALDEYDADEVLTRFRPEYVDRPRLNADLRKQGDPRRAFHDIYAPAIARWVAGDHDSDYTTPWRAFQSKTLEGLRTLTQLKARSVWAFTSAGPITAIVQALLGVPDAQAFEINWPMVNTSVTRIRFSAATGATSLSYLNAYPHLEERTDPALITFR